MRLKLYNFGNNLFSEKMIFQRVINENPFFITYQTPLRSELQADEARLLVNHFRLKRNGVYHISASYKFALAEGCFSANSRKL